MERRVERRVERWVEKHGENTGRESDGGRAEGGSTPHIRIIKLHSPPLSLFLISLHVFSILPLSLSLSRSLLFVSYSTRHLNNFSCHSSSSVASFATSSSSLLTRQNHIDLPAAEEEEEEEEEEDEEEEEEEEEEAEGASLPSNSASRTSR